MPREIERKYLLVSHDWRAMATHSKRYQQGYLSSDEKVSIRIRTDGEKAHLNIKSGTLGIERHEYEYEIPLEEGLEQLDLFCGNRRVDKTRYYVPVGKHTWEIDEFHGDNDGLIVAEIELASIDEIFEKPAWVGQEVSDDKRYYNVCLIDHPYKDWNEK